MRRMTIYGRPPLRRSPVGFEGGSRCRTSIGARREHWSNALLKQRPARYTVAPTCPHMCVCAHASRVTLLIRYRGGLFVQCLKCERNCWRVNLACYLYTNIYYIYIYAYVYVHIRKHIYTFVYIDVNIYIYIYTRTHIYTYTY